MAAVLALLILVLSAYAFYRYGFWALLLFPAIFAGLFFGMKGMVEDLPLYAVPYLIGTVAGATFKFERSMQFFIIASAFAVTLVSTGHFYYMEKFKGEDILKRTEVVASAIIKSTGASEKEKIEMGVQIRESMSIVKTIVPFIQFLGAILWSFLLFSLIRVLFVRLIVKHPLYVKGMEFFRLNDYTIFALIGCMAVVLISQKLGKPLFFKASLNVLLCIAFLYFLQALGIFRHFFIRKGWPLFLLPLGVAVLLLLGSVAAFIGLIMMAGFGALDLWADFRKLNGESIPDGERNE